MSITVKRTLFLFAKSDQAINVCVNIKTTISGAAQSDIVNNADEFLTDAELQAHAEADGRTTWDEDDICALLNCERAPALHP